jgi:DNA repair exonuclease SbcCD nuclease subunit
MIYFTGDVHRKVNELLRKLDYKQIPYTSDQIIILLGDVGVNYVGDVSDCVEKQKLQNSGRTYFCIHGNHEMRPESIETYEEQVWNGGAVYVEEDYPNLIFAKDGEVYDLEGIKILVLGGAYSVDKYYRQMMGYRWFADEQILKKRRSEILSYVKQLKEVDVVVSHTCPEQWQPTDLFLIGLDQSTVDKSTEEWLSEVERNLTYKHWLFAHFHANRKINEKVTMLYKDIISLNKLMDGSIK